MHLENILLQTLGHVLRVVRKDRLGRPQSAEAFWALLVALTTSPEIARTCGQGSLAIIPQETEGS